MAHLFPLNVLRQQFNVNGVRTSNHVWVSDLT